jgi:cobalt/nickel transport protein
VKAYVAAACLVLAAAAPVQAHFQELIPSTDIVPDEGTKSVDLTAVFTHPVEGGPTMDMDPPAAFGVLDDSKMIDLRGTLKPKMVDGKKAFEARYTFKKPGDYVFYLQPAPYWEAAEKHFLVHHTKVVVDFGAGETWDALVGAPMEIRPLSRPYGLWTGNLFRGVALKDGKPLPDARVEIEWVNEAGIKVPSDPFTTQIVKTDQNGIFAYAIPRAGWWGFNAITEGKITGPDGKAADAEVGGTIWVRAVDLK